MEKTIKISNTIDLTVVPNDDRPGVNIFIEKVVERRGRRITVAYASLAVAQDWEEFDDGTRVPQYAIKAAEKLAEKVGY